MIHVGYPAGKAGQIQVVDGLLSDTAAAFLSRVQVHWSESFQGNTLGGFTPAVKLSKDLYYGANTGLVWTEEDDAIEREICNALTSAIAIYRQTYNHLDSWVNIEDSGFQVQRYEKNRGFYRVHVDSFPIPNSSISDRVLAAIIYFNDVTYGGETNFPLHEVKVAPKAGRICLFPATFTHPHESCVPITSDKWIISTFILNRDSQPSVPHEHHDHTHDDHTHEPPPLIMGPMPEPLDFDEVIAAI